MKRIIAIGFIVLFAGSALARPEPWYTYKKGFSGKMTWEQFVWYMGVIFCGLIVVGAIILLLHTQLLRSPSTPRLVRLLRHLSPLVWLAFPFAMLMPIFYFYLTGYFYGWPVDSLGAFFVTSGVFVLSFLYFYLFNMVTALFSKRPFGKYAVNFNIVIAFILGSLYIHFYNTPVLLLLLFLCVLSSWLAMHSYFYWHMKAPGRLAENAIEMQC